MDLFFKWFKDFFPPKKRPGKALLILDGHASHCNAIDRLNLAAENEVVLLCLPSYTTQALQHLDSAFPNATGNLFLSRGYILDDTK